MLQHAHFDEKGGERTFAAVCTKVCFKGLADALPRLSGLVQNLCWRFRFALA
jgi:hypothetical protein